MKYNVGDKVLIKSIDWYNENKDENGYIRLGDYLFTPDLAKYCGEEFTISHITQFMLPTYVMVENGHEWSDEMIEGLVEEEIDLIPKFGEYSDNEPLDVPTMTTDFIKEHGLPCPEGYIFRDENGNVINATKIVLEKKKKEYPKTYKECCKVLGVNPYNYLTIRNVHCYDGEEETTKYERDLLGKFDYLWKLLICRDAYWKIAGEEMGLGKPWEPDYDSGVDKFGIVYFDNTIMRAGALHMWERHLNKVLEFPTEEIRDAFYENFKEEIESCKELL